MRCRGYAMSWKVTPYSPPRFSERHNFARGGRSLERTLERTSGWPKATQPIAASRNLNYLEPALATATENTEYVKEFFRIEKDGDGAFVGQLDRHDGSKNSGLHVHAEAAQRSTEFFEEAVGFVGRRGPDEAGRRWPRASP